MSSSVVEKWALFGVVLILTIILFLYFGKQNDDYSAEEKVSTAEVFFDIASAEDRIFEVEMDIRYSRYGDTLKHFNLSVDEAGDRAFSTVFISYRTAASEIPFSELITEEGKKLLHKRAWEKIKLFNDPSYEPVKVSGVNVKKMTPDPDPESVGRPTMFFLNEESGDARAGI